MSPQESLKLLADRSEQLYLVLDVKQNAFIYLNPAFKSLVSFKDDTSPAALLSLAYTEDLDYLATKYKACIEGEELRDFECRIHLQEEVHWLRIQPKLLKNTLEECILGCLIEDITLQKAYVDNLNAHNQKKNSILNILSHDLKGPLSVIENMSAMIHRQKLDIGPKIDKYVQLIQKTSRSCVELINAFIDQEFLETAAINLIKTRVELVAKTTDVMEKYHESQNHMRVRFLLESSHDKIFAEIDEDKFYQVINNLISNSLKFIKEEGQITIRIEQKEDKVLFIVADTGIGIPKKHHANLFDKFTSARRNGLGGEQSIGLGMSIIKTIVEWHEGNITFESEENKGTTFYIELPLNSPAQIKGSVA
ncbi:HAMP domain-containing histidine kinase [Pedobacter sp. MC2016-14]|uniref:sensor histidine kinase n=1 Tax=Pedobacter sp. MC2016-14 TaxID=2897327 RepID=UPI001E3758AA|nr:HAMP domain-containing sensor histidine kinase [Pedobacter sp. MC2016-14]MCD0486932.1 HAMP domain-containing histidine kinase [Pedobacter sp. MC2016-14]